MHRRTITYLVEEGTGMVWSRVDDKVAVPILDYAGMAPSNGFATRYYLEAFPILQALPGGSFIHTRKVETEIKNLHRAFWGMSALKDGHN